MFGGELRGMTKDLAESRNEAMARLMNEARNRGGNAIIGMRFDTTEVGDVWTEICAYGTAVQAVPVTDGAGYTASQLRRGLNCTGSTEPEAFSHDLVCISRTSIWVSTRSRMHTHSWITDHKSPAGHYRHIDQLMTSMRRPAMRKGVTCRRSLEPSRCLWRRRRLPD